MVVLLQRLEIFFNHGELKLERFFVKKVLQVELRLVILRNMSEIQAEDLQDIAIRAGALVLENGGETYRAEDTVVHVASSLGAKNASAFVTPTVVMFSYTDEDGKNHSMFRRIFKRGTNLSKLSQINSLSRRLKVRGKASKPEQIKRIIARIEHTPNYPRFFVIIMAAISSAFFTKMFDGSWLDTFWSFVFGGLLRIILMSLEKTIIGQNSLMISFISGAFLSICTDFISVTPMVCNTDLILIGAIMQCVPGLALVNGIRDITAGDLVSGGARLLDAFMIAAGLSVGSAVGVIILKVFGA